MGRKRIEIKPEPAERLKLLCKAEGIKGKELADSIKTSPQTISKILNLRTSLTEDNARRIINLYPNYRFEWLMGYDSYRTDTEVTLGVIADAQHEGEVLMLGLQSFASLCGFEITKELPEQDSTGLESVINRIHPYSVSHDGKKRHISEGELNRLQNEICDFVEFKLSKLIKEKNNG